MAALISVGMFATTYTVVGGSDALFGTAWSPASEANDMVADGSVFKLVKEGVELPAGTIEYKIVVDHGWDKSYPQSGNASFTLAKSGKYDVTFTLNLSASPEYSVAADLKGEVVIDPTVFMKGSWDSWADAVNFVLASDKKSASVTKEFDADTYEFKTVLNGNDWRSNGATLTRYAASAAGISGNNDANMELVADVKGNYTFTWTFETNALTITFPEKGEEPETPVDSMTVYFVNNLSWAAINAFVWPETGNAYKAWPGEGMKKQAEKINEYDVYAYTFPAKFANVIFDNGTAQTVDLAWAEAKPYFVPGAANGEGKYEGTWYAKSEIPSGETPDPETPVDSMTVYILNNLSWEAINAFVWVGEDVYKAWPGEGMKKQAEKINDLDVYAYTFPAKYTSIIFDNGTAQTVDLAWAEAKPYFVPGAANGEGKYEGTWYAKSEIPSGETPDPETPVDSMTVYILNNLSWEAINAFVWVGEDVYKAWPGEGMKKQAEKINDLDVYAYTFPAKYTSIIFDNGTAQTVDLAWAEAKPYFVPGAANGEGKYEGTWYAKSEIPSGETPDPETPVDSMTVYYVNYQGWETVKAFVWVGEDVYKAWSGEEMTKTALKALEKDVYSYTFPAKFVNIIFNDGINQTTDLVWDKDKPYYCEGEWYAKIDDIKPVEAAKFYITGDSAFVIDAGLEIAKKWNSAAIKVTEDSYEVSLKGGQIYQMVFTIDGKWETKTGYAELVEKPAGVSTDENNNIIFSLKEAGKVKVIKTEAGFKVEGNFYVYVPEHANGLYLMGSYNDWTIEDKYMFASTEVEGEYKLNVTLAKDQEIKPAYVENDKAIVWYPAEGGNYVVAEKYAGNVTIYFRPAGNEDPAWAEFGGYMYIMKNSGTGINNTAVDAKAVKVLRNGMLVIEKAGVNYNVMGQIVR